jgi:hypothetical protein
MSDRSRQPLACPRGECAVNREIGAVLVVVIIIVGWFSVMAVYFLAVRASRKERRSRGGSDR